MEFVGQRPVRRAIGRRILSRGCLVGVLLLLGCTRDEDYYQVMREQQDAMKEVTEVLETVKEQKTMAEAKSSLERLRQKFDAIAQKANSLPKPPPRKVLERMQEEKLFTERNLERLRREVKRVSDLPGGAQLWKEFESGSPGLFPVGPP